MAAVVNAWKGLSTSTSVAVTVAPTAGNALYVQFSAFAGTVGNHAVTDNVGSGTWVRLPDSGSTGAGSKMSRWVQFNVPSGVTTVTLNGGTGTAQITGIIHEIAGGAGAYTVGESAVSTYTYSGVTTVTTGAVTNATAASIFFASLQNESGSNPATMVSNFTGSSPTGWAAFSANSQELDGSANIVCSCVYLVVASSASTTHTWDTDGVDTVVGLVAFHAAAGGGGSPYSLSCAAASFAETGKAAAFLRGYVMASAAGSEAITGKAATLTKTGAGPTSTGHGLFPLRLFVASRRDPYFFYNLRANGDQQLIAKDLFFGSTQAFSLSCAAGSYAITGKAATLTKAGSGGSPYSLTCVKGTFAISGQAATPRRAITLTAVKGTYSWMTGKNYSTVFPSTENPISESGNWVNGGTTGLDWKDVRTTPGQAWGTQDGNSGTDDSTALLTGTWGADQVLQAVAKVPTTQDSSMFEEIEFRLRSAISAHTNSGYEVNFRCLSNGSQYIQIVRWNGPFNNFSYVDSTTGPGIKDGDVLKASIVGSTITAYVNGVAVLSNTDTTYTSGQPGIGFYFEDHNGPPQHGTNSEFGWKSLVVSDTVNATFYRGRALSCAAGSFAETGVAASLKATRKLTQAAGSYAETGVAAALKSARSLTLSAGSYTETGVAASLKSTRKLTQAAGSYTISGVAATLTYISGGGHYTLTAAGVTYTETGVAASLKSARLGALSAGSYAESGKAANLLVGHRLAQAAGSYSESGVAASFYRGRAITAAAGAYSETGVAAQFSRTRAITASPGAYVVTGKDVTFRFTHILGASRGTFSYTGNPATLSSGTHLTFSAGTFTQVFRFSGTVGRSQSPSGVFVRTQVPTGAIEHV